VCHTPCLLLHLSLHKHHPFHNQISQWVSEHSIPVEYACLSFSLSFLVILILVEDHVCSSLSFVALMLFRRSIGVVYFSVHPSSAVGMHPMPNGFPSIGHRGPAPPPGPPQPPRHLPPSTSGVVSSAGYPMNSQQAFTSRSKFLVYVPF
jgi:hypothetical protein